MSDAFDTSGWWRLGAAAVMRAAITVVLAVAALSLAAQESIPALPRLLDGFNELTPWHAAASDGVKVFLRDADGATGRAMRLDFDLAGTAGYALAHRMLPLDLPENYELSFYVRADAPVNNLQFKLIDASGDNVWWFNRPNFAFGTTWQQVRIKKRQIDFAWGPTSDHVLRHAASIEFVVAAGRDGGAGSVYVSDLSIRELPPDPVSWPVPSIRASSQRPGAGPELVFDGQRSTAWESDPAAGANQTLTVDFGRTREFGGLIVRWADGASASRYDVEFSDDAVQWRTVRHVIDARGGPDALFLPDAETRFVRLALKAGPGPGYAMSELEIRDVAFGSSPNAFLSAVAREFPRGYFPRGFSGEQTYWTLVGVDGGRDTGLLSEDGSLEVGKGGFSIEPFVVSGGTVVTWADVEPQQNLRDGYLPVPGVTWRHADWTLHISSFASGSRGDPRLLARYEIVNRSARTLHLELALAVRPFQVNPPTQSLNTVGGASPIHDIAWNGVGLDVDGARTIFPLRLPNRVGVFPFDAGPLPVRLSTLAWDAAARGHDDVGFASAVLGYNVTLAPHARTAVDVVVPLSGAHPPVTLQAPDAESWVAREQHAVLDAWREKLNRVSLRVPPVAQPLADTLRTALAHVLITRDGPALRPGTRSYARSWIRDGAMMAEALLRLGHADVAADYLRWYAPYQFDNGKIPCCVDARGADPVPENDSPGEFIFLAAEIYRYAHDRALADAMWPRVAAAAGYMDSLRRSERTPNNLADNAKAFYGLLPASISHEGYSEKPMHSYWDDFWAVKGYEGAIDIATALGRNGDAQRLAVQRDEFREDLGASLRRATAEHAIAYVPGCAELGDFDPTSTSIAFAPGAQVKDLPAAMVSATFDRYWNEFVARRDGRKAWNEYTPYELRTVGTFVRLGWRDRAQQLLRFFLADRRPEAWNQWAEVVGRDPRQPRFVGDMPHGWIASDFIRATLDLFAYERYADRTMVIGAGVPLAWIEGRGIQVSRLRTPYGDLSYSLKARRERIELDVSRDTQLPPGGLVFVWPGTGPPPAATINGRAAAWRADELYIGELPARVLIGSRQRDDAIRK